MSARALIGAGCALLALCGCWTHRGDAKPLTHISAQTSPQVASVHRIAVLPFSLGEGVGASASAIDAALASALRELDAFEVVAVSAERRDQLLARDPVLTNDIGSADLLALRDALAIDAVVVGRVDQYQGYDPLSLGVTCHLISCRDGGVLWSATGDFDASRADTQTDIERWHHGAIGEVDRSLSGWHATLSSPSLFCRYVADRLAATLRR